MIRPDVFSFLGPPMYPQQPDTTRGQRLRTSFSVTVLPSASEQDDERASDSSSNESIESSAEEYASKLTRTCWGLSNFNGAACYASATIQCILALYHRKLVQPITEFQAVWTSFCELKCQSVQKLLQKLNDARFLSEQQQDAAEFLETLLLHFNR